VEVEKGMYDEKIVVVFVVVTREKGSTEVGSSRRREVM
jgi:hypothetical protein